MENEQKVELAQATAQHVEAFLHIASAQGNTAALLAGVVMGAAAYYGARYAHDTDENIAAGWRELLDGAEAEKFALRSAAEARAILAEQATEEQTNG